jgi:hypothetical protein
MPYVDCIRCGLTAFSASYRGAADHCERCGTELPRPRVARRDNPGFLGLRSPHVPFGASVPKADRVASTADGEIPL